MKIFPKICESLFSSCNSIDAKKSLYLDLYQWNVEKKNFHLRTDRQQQIWKIHAIRVARKRIQNVQIVIKISCEWNIYLRFIFFFFPFSSVFVKIWISINVHDPFIIYANATERFVDFNASVILDKWPFVRIQCKWRRRVCQSGKKLLTLSFLLFPRVKTRIWRVVEHRLRNCRVTPSQMDA